MASASAETCAKNLTYSCLAGSLPTQIPDVAGVEPVSQVAASTADPGKTRVTCSQMDAFPELRTDRLRLGLLASDRASEVAAFFEHNLEHFEPWDPPHPDDFVTQAFWRDRLERNRAECTDGHSLRFFLLLRDTGAIGGTCSFDNFSHGPFQACTLGYGLGREYEGQGLMSEALNAAIPYVFGVIGLHRIMANYMPENERSSALLERLGFEREGYAKDYLFIRGAWRDHVLTALTNPNPKPPTVE